MTNTFLTVCFPIVRHYFRLINARWTVSFSVLHLFGQNEGHRMNVTSMISDIYLLNFSFWCLGVAWSRLVGYRYELLWWTLRTVIKSGFRFFCVNAGWYPVFGVVVITAWDHLKWNSFGSDEINPLFYAKLRVIRKRLYDFLCAANITGYMHRSLMRQWIWVRQLLFCTPFGFWDEKFDNLSGGNAFSSILSVLRVLRLF